MHLKGVFLPGGGSRLQLMMKRLSPAHADDAVGLENLAQILAPRSTVRPDGLCAVAGEPSGLSGSGLVTPDSLLDAYREAGPACLCGLAGSFSLVIVDPARRLTLLAVDRMGIGRLTYSVGSGQLVFSSRADEVANATDLPREIDAQRLYEFLFFHMMPSPGTAFSGVSKLPPAHFLELSPTGVRVERFWTPDFVPDPNWDTTMAVECLHELLSAAVSDAARDPGTVGSFLSGGLDSSAVSGYLRQSRQAMAGSFSIGFGVAEFDELQFAREANRHFDIVGHEYHVTPTDIVDDFERIAGSYDEPFGNSSVVPTYRCAKMAREHGVDCLLAGDGGDELFAGNERYGKQQVFELYWRLPSIIRRGAVAPLAGLISPDNPITPLRKFRSYVDQASIPLPDRLEWWNYIYQQGLDTILAPEALPRVDRDRPLEHMRAVYADTEAEDTVNRMLAYDWRFTLADNDLRKVTAMCELAGVRVKFPMLHDSLVDFSTHIPIREKIRGTELRRFFRQAMDGFLPPMILQKHKHGFGLPFGVWLKTETPLRDMIFSLLRELSDTGILRRSFVDDLIAAQRSGDAGFYGYFIWDLAMFQAWCRHHGVTFRG
jgi:asparagine synthase (glutamine-hydrolysing)